MGKRKYYKPINNVKNENTSKKSASPKFITDYFAKVNPATYNQIQAKFDFKSKENLSNIKNDIKFNIYYSGNTSTNEVRNISDKLNNNQAIFLNATNFPDRNRRKPLYKFHDKPSKSSLPLESNKDDRIEEEYVFENPEFGELTYNGAYADYNPCELKLGKAHPYAVVESRSMSTMKAPEIKYKLNIPFKVLNKGILSRVQLEAMIYSCQKHEEYLTDHQRAGFLIGDGAGVGKGRTIAGIIYENYILGRKRSIWLSVSNDLREDAIRDLVDLEKEIKFNIEVKSLNKMSYGKIDSKENGQFSAGVLFVTYSSLISNCRKSSSSSKKVSFKSRLDQIIDWFGSDYDGVIIFDECHKAKNLLKETKTGIIVKELQIKLKNSRVVYASATGATEPEHMGYMVRLGLWGPDKTFENFKKFEESLSKHGVGAMELIAIEMKMKGIYLSRQLSFKGVQFEIQEIPMENSIINGYKFRDVYDKCVEFWIKCHSEFRNALARNNFDLKTRKVFLGQFWGAHQRFFKYLCLSGKIGKCVEIVKNQIANDKCVIIGLQSTGEARTLGAISNSSEDLIDFVSSAKGVLMSLIENFYPSRENLEKFNKNQIARKNKVNVKCRKNLEIEINEFEHSSDDSLTFTTKSKQKVSKKRNWSKSQTKKSKLNVSDEESYSDRFSEEDSSEYQPKKRIKFSEEGSNELQTKNRVKFSETQASTNQFYSLRNKKTNLNNQLVDVVIKKEKLNKVQDKDKINKIDDNCENKKENEFQLKNMDKFNEEGSNEYLPKFYETNLNSKNDELHDVVINNEKVNTIPDKDKISKIENNCVNKKDNEMKLNPKVLIDNEINKQLLENIEEIDKMLPVNILDQLINDLGGSSCVAEMTGRKGGIYEKEGCVSYQTRKETGFSLDQMNIIEKNRFNSGEKLIGIISDAASTGISLHSDKRFKNKRQRVHITLELPWSADKAIQQFGRTHRSNQVIPPHYLFIISDLAGERRFAATVAKRLEMLGALTNGDRRCANTRDLSQFNLDNKFGNEAVNDIIQSIFNNYQLNVPFPNGLLDKYNRNVKLVHEEMKKALENVGLYHNQIVNVPKFLNRILGLKLDMQNGLFQYFLDTIEHKSKCAKERNEFDHGIRDVANKQDSFILDETRILKLNSVSDKEEIQVHKIRNIITGVSWEVADKIYQKNTSENKFCVSKRGFVKLLVLAEHFKNDEFKLITIQFPPKTISRKSLSDMFSEIECNEAKLEWERIYTETEHKCLHVIDKGECFKSNCTYGKRTKFNYIITGAVFIAWELISTVYGNMKMEVIRVELDDGMKLIGGLISSSRYSLFMKVLEEKCNSINE